MRRARRKSGSPDRCYVSLEYSLINSLQLILSILATRNSLTLSSVDQVRQLHKCGEAYIGDPDAARTLLSILNPQLSPAHVTPATEQEPIITSSKDVEAARILAGLSGVNSGSNDSGGETTRAGEEKIWITGVV